MMTLTSKVGWFLFPLAVMAGVNAQADTLTDALINAYRSSEHLKSQRAYVRSVDEGVAQATAALRPSVSASASLGNTYSFASQTSTQSANLSLSAGLTLWDGGAGDIAKQVAELNVLNARLSLVTTEQQVLMEAVTAYLDMRREVQFLQLAENSRDVIDRQVQATQDRFDVGEARRTDVNQAQAMAASASSVVALRQGGLEIARERYHIATGFYPGTLDNPPPLPSVPASLEAAKDIALRTHPSVAQAKNGVKVAQLNVLRAEAAMKPRISGSLGLDMASTNTDRLTLSIGAKAPIYQGGALTSQHRQAIELQVRSSADLHITSQSIVQNVTRFWAELKIARASIAARHKEVRSSRVALQGIREEADLGARTALDILNAEQDLLQAQTNLVSAQRDEHIAAYSLLSAMGLLTVNHLKLGIQGYDPAVNYKKVSGAPVPSDRSKLLEKIFMRAGKN